ncbi:MAG TPA: L-threonylcarbamoyladenylate synthase [Acidimicrobiales bacterium]|nr:L-threonylcarbamoyladenylate synthase [Acidimicrobiales bacterium]
MGTVPAFGDPPPPEAVEAAVKALAAGQVVGLPTDTVYGLAADPFSTGGADRLFRLKRRPRELELPVLVADEEQALSLTTAVPGTARRLMERFWPGALTVVLPRNPELVADLGADDATVGLRCPAHPVPIALCRAHGPIATTSANHHGEPTLTTAAAVAGAFGEAVAVVLDGGTCEGSPSTVVDCTGLAPKLLREGRVPWEDVLAAAAGA